VLQRTFFFIRIIGVPPQFLSYCPTSTVHPCHLAGKSPVWLSFTTSCLHDICLISLDHLRRPAIPTRSVDGLTFIHLPLTSTCWLLQIFLLPKDSYWLEHTAIYYPISFICQLLSQLSAQNCVHRTPC